MTNTTKTPGTGQLVALLDGRVVGTVLRDNRGHLSFTYEETWRAADDSYPLSLSMPLTAADHKHSAVNAYLWGLLPDNDHTLTQYARTFGVSDRSAVALLEHIGADCAGAVQLVPPHRLQEVEGPSEQLQVNWISDEEVARELQSAKRTGLPGRDRKTLGRFSLAGAQPKIALFHRHGKWGIPLGRTPTTHILKPPTAEYPGFAENEHFCLDLTSELGLRAAGSTIQVFDGEVAIVIDRFDRILTPESCRRIHQEDACQALSVLPWKKYENEGGPGAAAIITLIQETSIEPETDLSRFVDMLVLNWVLAATDAHAKNFAFLHVPGGGTRLAPFYDIASYLPYSDRRLYEIKLAMRVGKEYLVRRVRPADWARLATSVKVPTEYVFGRIELLLPRIPEATQAVADRAIANGLSSEFVAELAKRIIERSRECAEQMMSSHARPQAESA